MEQVRILHIVPNMQSGGLETFIMNLYRNIDRTKIQFDFLVHYKERKFYDDEIEKLGGKIYRFSLRNDNNIFKYVKELDKFFKEHKEYKILHCHMASIGFLAFFIARRNGVKVRISHSHNSATDKTIKGRIKRILMLPYKYVTTLNFACSTLAGKYLYGKKEFEVIPNAIEVDRFKFNEKSRWEIRDNLSITEDIFLIGHIGRFNIQKNHDFLINIFNEYHRKNKKSKLLLIGDGELKDKIIQKVNDLQLSDDVIFTGNVKNVNDYYNAMDVFVLPSLFEGLPVVGVEAQANGLPFIVSDKVSNELNLSEKVNYLELDIPKWVKKLEEINHSCVDRLCNFEKLSQSEYNAKKQAECLQIKYTKLMKEKKENES